MSWRYVVMNMLKAVIFEDGNYKFMKMLQLKFFRNFLNNFIDLMKHNASHALVFELI